jgi:4-amino-4-deoxy-L-arabinose transferase-like glycosyltransferase
MVAIFISYRLIEQPHWLWWVALGVALAIAMLLRMAVVFFFPALFLWIFTQLPNKRKFVPVILTVLIIIGAILPFTIRNYRLWGEFLLLESQFGHVFWNGNHPDHNGEFRAAEVYAIPKEILSSQNDALITNQLLELGIQNVLNDPAHFVKLTLTRLRLFFTFWPTADSSFQANFMRVISFGLLVPVIIVGLLLHLKDWRKLFLIYLFLLIHTGIYAISWTMVRYRMPLDVFFIMFAASALILASDAWKARNSSPIAGQVAPDNIVE